MLFNVSNKDKSMEQRYSMDASLIDASTSNGLVMDTHIRQNTLMMVIETGEKTGRKKKKAKSTPAISLPPIRMLLVFIQPSSKARLRYKTHRAVDALHEIITPLK